MIGSIHNHSMPDSFSGYGRDAGAHGSGSLDGSAAETRQNDRGQHAGHNRQLSEEEQQQVQQLKQRDQEVRAHERAHMAAGADLVQGGASFTFERGPDGKMYAVGGEVKIDTSTENDPDQTIRKMQQVKRAALAPAEPSGADQSVAAQAGQVEAQARQEKNKAEEGEVDTATPETLKDPQASGAIAKMPGRRPYSAEPVGRCLNITV